MNRTWQPTGTISDCTVWACRIWRSCFLTHEKHLSISTGMPSVLLMRKNRLIHQPSASNGDRQKMLLQIAGAGSGCGGSFLRFLIAIILIGAKGWAFLPFNASRQKRWYKPGTVELNFMDLGHSNKRTHWIKRIRILRSFERGYSVVMVDSWFELGAYLMRRYQIFRRFTGDGLRLNQSASQTWQTAFRSGKAFNKIEVTSGRKQLTSRLLKPSHVAGNHKLPFKKPSRLASALTSQKLSPTPHSWLTRLDPYSVIIQ